MTSALFTARLGSEFDAFLFAPVGDDDGHPLSMISALARLDLDPWQEAISLASLPTIAATQRLTYLIAALPGAPASHIAPAAIATRLAGLLPRLTGAGNAATVTPNADVKERLKSGLLMGAMFVIVTMGFQWAASNKEMPTKVDSTAAQISSPIDPKVPLSR